MNSHSLIDLVLGGVKWELAETPNQFKIKTQIIPEKTIPVIPTNAPINIDYAETEANKAKDLNGLCKIINEFNHPLRYFTKKTVLPSFGEFNNNLLIITDSPSEQDEENGTILTDSSGELLDKMLNAIELNRKMVSLSPLLFWRTPGGRGATNEELDLAKPFIKQIIFLLRPRAILTLGTVAASRIANINLLKNHGEIVEIDSVPIIPVYHPNYLLLKPGAKKDVWEALQKLQKILKSADK